jgi:hypothetical protein
MLLNATLLLAMLSAQPEASASVEAARKSRNRAEYELGSGLTFRFGEDQHMVGLGGFIQPAWTVEVVDDFDPPDPMAETVEGNTDQFLRVRRSFLNLKGQFFDRTLEFVFQTDFSLDEPLLDAWLGYNPFSWLSLSLGQRQTSTLNREQQHIESDLSFVDRSLLSRTFSESGRELGGYVDLEFDIGGILVRPRLAATSGDGRNSFGEDSRDRDVGGLKWGGRLDVLPFGDFAEGNRNTVPDLAGESSFKVIAGVAGSYNDGASEARGAGHDEFSLFEEGGGGRKQPDYVQIYADLLAKYQGFSLLVEFVNATATSLDGTFTNEAGTIPLVAGEISEFLILGNAVNAQLGYVFGFGLAVDVRYTQLFAEFDDRETSLLQDTRAYGGGFAWYFFGHALKAQLNFERVEEDLQPDIHAGELLIQVIL